MSQPIYTFKSDLTGYFAALEYVYSLRLPFQAKLIGTERDILHFEDITGFRLKPNFWINDMTTRIVYTTNPDLFLKQRILGRSPITYVI